MTNNNSTLNFDGIENFIVDPMEPGTIYSVNPAEKAIKKLESKNARLQKRLRNSLIFATIFGLISIILAIALIITIHSTNEKMEAVIIERDNAIKKMNNIKPSILTVYAPDPEDETVEEITEVEEEPEIAIPDTSKVFDTIALFKDIPLSDSLKQYIYESAIEANIPPEVLFSLMWKESSYNPNAKSSTNDHGLCQINECNFPTLAKEFGYTEEEFWDNIYDPYLNVACSISILTDYRNNYNNDNWHHVLMRYNLGPSGAQEKFNEGIYSTIYSREILAHAEEAFNFTDIERGV